MRHAALVGFAVVVGLAGSGLARAAAIASDNAGNYSVANPWATGSNQGTGFGAWQFTGTDYFYLGDAGNNGGAGANTGAINTSNVSWGMSSNDDNGIAALRPFTSGGSNNSTALATGQSVKFDFDNGWVPGGGGVIGVSLVDSANSNTRFEYFFTGGANNYTLSDSSGQSTTHGFTDAGMQGAFTLTGADTYSFAVTFLDNSTTETFTGSLKGTTGGAIDGIRMFNYKGGFNDTNNQYFNSFAVVPEPVSLSLFGIGTLGLLASRRRRA